MFSKTQPVGCFSLLFYIIVLSLSLSFWVIQEVSVMKGKLRLIKKDLHFQSVQLQSSSVLNHDILMFDTWEGFQRIKRELAGCTPELSFLQLAAKADGKPQFRGNVTVIPWAVALQHGTALAMMNNKIIVKEDGYFMMYSQVLFLNPSTVMGHEITRKTSGVSGRNHRVTSLFRCLQEMPEENAVNTCYTAGIARLHSQDELELVVPDRSEAQIAMDTESTFFGVIQL
ncbi:tumor necrosis factor ligand superfamily member 13B-like [Astyanax mexicanus]|uniref:Tumor necrosis factor ligand superfamily member 13B-like n=1 Tax=Astyanax mexicanus TaxID=7994 RepID=A0A8T2LPX9_ASTMX|nr:tumor necrosis factor ligand superfamily member 13B-like [Astyanax mexicanus]